MFFSADQILKSEPCELLGDYHPLVSQLGSTEGLSAFSVVSHFLQMGRVSTACELDRFLKTFQEQLLFPIELPTIKRAFEHANNNELRELVEFSKSQDACSCLEDFQSASRRVGRDQMLRLRPLRDSRFVQRFLRLMDTGEAEAWHTIVYGITLSLYSLPLRQGLVHYAAETLRGFVQIACQSISISERLVQDMLRRRFEDLIAEVESMVGGDQANNLRVFR